MFKTIDLKTTRRILLAVSFIVWVWGSAFAQIIVDKGIYKVNFSNTYHEPNYVSYILYKGGAGAVATGKSSVSGMMTSGWNALQMRITKEAITIKAIWPMPKILPLIVPKMSLPSGITIACLKHQISTGGSGK